MEVALTNIIDDPSRAYIALQYLQSISLEELERYTYILICVVIPQVILGNAGGCCSGFSPFFSLSVVTILSQYYHS